MPLFDSQALDRFRARAERRGDSFLDARIWEDIADRILLLGRKPSTALLLGPSSAFAPKLAKQLDLDIVTDPDRADNVDLVLAVRWAESEDDLPEKLAALALILPPDTPMIGASLGGDSIRALRAALLDADKGEAGVAPRAHPRIEPSAFAELLQRTGFTQPVVDVDPVTVRYSSVQRLIDDLRDLGAMNALQRRPRAGVSKAWRQRLEAAFPPGTEERFDILYFSAWTGTR